MTNPSTIDPLSLPSVPVVERKRLPVMSCVYFVLDDSNQIQYIGATTNLRQRWNTHKLKGEVGMQIHYSQTDRENLSDHEVTKLIVFDKDGTLTEPKGGNTFVQHPQDQQLRPGVAQKLEQLRADGWSMAIASNQGGCAKLDLVAHQLKIGMWWHTPKYGTTPWKISDIQSIDDRVCIFGESEESDGGKWNTTISNDAPCSASYKSIEEAIAEMSFALKLAGIDDAGCFCPDMAGDSFYMCFADGSGGEATGYYPRELRGQYRKPSGGMLQAIEQRILVAGLPNQRLMVGDRPEDQAAAEAAGFAFEWADVFFGGGRS